MNKKSFTVMYKGYTTNFKGYSEDRLSATNFLSSIYYSKIAQNGKVPSSVNMFSIIGCKKDNVDTKIIKNWGLDGERSADAITKSLKVAIGRTEADDAYLDLHEKADGPHMLVAGTTGSGKTETIISYLLALCMKFRPDELNLLLVDMKGGGFTQRLGNLPHVVGMVTDVDGYESGMGSAYMLNRFLYALKAEIDRRKHLLKKMHVDSIDGYITACSGIDAHITRKNIKGDEARELRNLAAKEKLTHLILVVDEFTELKRFSSENNDVDFIGEITTIARIGRSLGLHIILISQNIEGAITDDIRVNSNSRLCLKVATKQASREMIGNDLAASPYMPGHGRGYLLVGTGSKFDYFQSAYSGTDVDEIASIDITLASKNGLYESFYSSERDNTEFINKKKQREQEGKAKSQLELIVESICKVNREENGDYRPHMIFNAPLQKELHLSDCRDSSQKNLLAMGLYDAPQIQKQPVFYLDLYRSNVAVFGQPMSGKTGFIKTMLTRMHQKSALVPEENVYIIDFGGNMGDYADLPYVCACFDKSNEENIRRIFYSVEERVRSNSAALGSRNYYAQYLKDPKGCPPHITLIIENINALLLDDRYETYKERLMLLCRDGLSKGLTIVFTANDTASLANYLTNFGQKVAFEMPENSYGDIFSGKVNAVMRSAGRGIINKDGETFEFQCCLPYDSNEEEELKNLRAGIKGYENKHRLISFGKELNAGNFTQYSESAKPYVNADYRIITGLDYYEHKVVSVDIIKDRVITIYGKRQIGKTNLLKLLMKGILDNDDQTQFIYFDDGRKELEQFYRATADRSIMFRSLDDFYKYLQQIPGMPSKPDPAYNPPRKLTDDHPIVFVLQSKMLYAEDPKSNAIMTSFLPKLISE
ncbi:MAG: hypothetical protein II712_00965, partial [Erysipelotrichaceae bacterium]|nr:hypothetical protein [Erysipelotrichaceae bacterium]